MEDNFRLGAGVILTIWVIGEDLEKTGEDQIF
jgi:hypothetical protein